MLPLTATLAILGAFLLVILWLCIVACTSTWYSPFKKAQRYSRAGYHVVIHEAIPDALTATIALAIVQEFVCFFVLCDLIIISVRTSSTENPVEKTLLAHLLGFWSAITVGSTIICWTIVMAGSRILEKLTRFSQYHREPRQTRQSDEVDVEDQSPYFSDPSYIGDADDDWSSGYGTFSGSTRVEDYPDSSHRGPWAFRIHWWTQQVFAAEVAERSTFLHPISGLQTELSDADDEIGLP
ncbi:MAG: hypothetical protein HETSPECPRED_006061 [Heterodermia speciosa]|uniref:Uncharacterized protein n=1 Tax=Heterodermia speciosa TaxID=116794 RepID=A0A8H3I613_9LECA|nr:MAG: hypothetical protein HETSPECPRED_006061 [Heterodermia speciosa]